MSMPYVSITVAANQSCKIYALVETLSVFQKGTTAEKVRDGISAGQGMTMPDGMEYIVIWKAFSLTESQKETVFKINMEDYMSGDMPDDGGDMPEEDMDDGMQEGNGVFIVVEDDQGQLSEVYSFEVRD